MCQVLDTPRANWLQLATFHCAVTTIVVGGEGDRKLVRYGETAHLTEQVLTG